MAKLFNRAKMTTSTTGSGTVTLGSASVGYQSFADAGVSNGDVVQYVIEEGGNFEIGTGTYSSTGTSLTRSPTESSNSDAAISLGGAATVSITAVADDLNRLQHEGSTKVEPSATGATVTGNLAVTGTVDGRDVSADGSKLDGIESGATADQTAAEIRSLVESATDSNVFTDADHTKLNGIESGATADQTASEILTAIKTVDGSGSGLDADLLDGKSAAASQSSNTIAARTSSGYLHASYFNGTGTFSTSAAGGSMGMFTGTNGTDTYGRSYSAAQARTLLNVENGATGDQTASEILTAIKTVDGAASGLDADLLDGQQGSYYLNTSTTFSGDVSGTYNNIVVANDSHTHDGRYYTETEADSRFVNVTGDTMTGNLTLSGSGFTNQLEVKRGDGAYYSYIKYANTSGELGRMGFTNTGALAYRVGTSGTDQRIFHDSYHPNADKWTTARTLSLSGDASGSVSWDGSANATLSVAVADDSHNHTWDNIDGGSVNSWSSLRVSTGSGYIDFGPANASWAHIYTDRPAFYLNKELYVNNNKVWNAGNDGSGSGLDADTVDGIQASSFLRSDTSDTMTGDLTVSENLKADGGNILIGDDAYSTSSSYVGMKTSYMSGTSDYMMISGTSDGNTYISAKSGNDVHIRGGGNNSVYAITVYPDRWPSVGNSAHSIWHAGNDGSGSGLDADTLDGYHASSFHINGYGNDVTADAAYVDNWFRAMNDVGLYFENHGTGLRSPISEGGQYGSVATYGGENGWEGWSIGGRVVFMHDMSNAWGIYDDVDNEWMIYGTRNAEVRLRYNGVDKLQTSSTGVTVTGDLNSTSDIRYKKNIETIDSALEKVQSLRGVTFDWDHEDFNSDSRATGVIAQDVEKVLPEAVRENEDGFKNVAYGNMVGLLIEAIKEQQEQIDELKKQLNS